MASHIHRVSVSSRPRLPPIAGYGSRLNAAAAESHARSIV